MEKDINKISRVEIQKVLDRLKERSETEKGKQPELALGCFYDSGRTDNEVCLKCPLYEVVCQQYLKGFEANRFG
jgi:hypothetical protein